MSDLPLGGREGEPESVAAGAVLLGVVLQIAPEVIRERVFLADILIEDLGERWLLVFEFGELEAVRIFSVAEADDVDAFPVLRNERLSVDHSVIDVVSERIQRIDDRAVGASAVMVAQVLHVLEEERPGAAGSAMMSRVLKKRCPWSG